MLTHDIHVKTGTYGIQPVIHAVEGETGRFINIYTDDRAVTSSEEAELSIHRPDDSYYTDDHATVMPDSGEGQGFYNFSLVQALTRSGKVDCQLKISNNGLVLSTYTFCVIVEPSTTGLPVAQLGYDIYDLIEAAETITPSPGLTDDIKQALLDCFEHVAWTDEHGQDYVDALEAALYPPAELASISAVYTQSGTVYTTDSLDDLKSDLVVTATYTDSTTETVTTYTLSGTLTEGTSVITVSYGGKTTTFNVTVTAPATLSSITAVYTQSGTVYDTDTLDSLKSDLAVTAVYSDSTTQTVASADYTLSGTLTVGTSTITVTYEGKTDTFTVTVTSNALVEYNPSWLTRDTSATVPTWTIAANDVTTASNGFPDYLAVVICNQETSFPTGYRTSSVAQYASRTSGWTTHTYAWDSSLVSHITEVVVDGKSYAYITFTKAQSDAAYALWEAAITNNEISTGGKIQLLNSAKTYNEGMDVWMLNVNVTSENIDDIVSRLPSHSS